MILRLQCTSSSAGYILILHLLLWSVNLVSARVVEKSNQANGPTLALSKRQPSPDPSLDDFFATVFLNIPYYVDNYNEVTWGNHEVRIVYSRYTLSSTAPGRTYLDRRTRALRFLSAFRRFIGLYANTGDGPQAFIPNGWTSLINEGFRITVLLGDVQFTWLALEQIAEDMRHIIEADRYITDGQIDATVYVPNRTGNVGVVALRDTETGDPPPSSSRVDTPNTIAPPVRFFGLLFTGAGDILDIPSLGELR